MELKIHLTYSKKVFLFAKIIENFQIEKGGLNNIKEGMNNLFTLHIQDTSLYSCSTKVCE